MKNLLFFSILLFAGCDTKETYFFNAQNISIENDTLSIQIADKEYIESQEDTNELKLSEFRNNYKDSSKIMVADVEQLLIAEWQQQLETLQKRNHIKNQEIFPFKATFYALKNKEINVWAIIFILLFSGVLGGLARTKFHLLKELETQLEKVKMKKEDKVNEKLEQEKPKIKNLNRSKEELIKYQNDIADLNEKIISLETTIAELQKIIESTKKSKVSTGLNILFSLIASCLSFIVLTTFRSEVLEFKSPIDYFTFLAVCLLCAVFAKRTIIGMYEKVMK